MDYITVSQYAKLVGKDPANIRRMLLNGTLKGEKLGSQWVLPRDTAYPADRRVKSGQYRNWRKTGDVLNAKQRKFLNSMCAQLAEIYGHTLEQVVLYGSYARGEQTSESDMDIALFLRSEQTEEQHDAMTDIVVENELEQGVTISAVTVDSGSFAQWKGILPYYQNIGREGIVLWKAQ